MVSHRQTFPVPLFGRGKCTLASNRFWRESPQTFNPSLDGRRTTSGMKHYSWCVQKALRIPWS